MSPISSCFSLRCLCAIVIGLLSLFMVHVQAAPHQTEDLQTLRKGPKKPPQQPPEDPNHPERGPHTPGPTNQLQTPLEKPEIVCDIGPTINPDTLAILFDALKKLEPGAPSMPVNDPGHCGQIGCYFNQGLEWCNEDLLFMRLPSYDPIMEAGYMIRDSCQHGWDASKPAGDWIKKGMDAGKFSGIATFPISNFSVTIKGGYKC